MERGFVVGDTERRPAERKRIRWSEKVSGGVEARPVEKPPNPAGD